MSKYTHPLPSWQHSGHSQSMCSSSLMLVSNTANKDNQKHDPYAAVNLITTLQKTPKHPSPLYPYTTNTVWKIAWIKINGVGLVKALKVIDSKQGTLKYLKKAVVAHSGSSRLRGWHMTPRNHDDKDAFVAKWCNYNFDHLTEAYKPPKFWHENKIQLTEKMTLTVGLGWPPKKSLFVSEKGIFIHINT